MRGMGFNPDKVKLPKRYYSSWDSSNCECDNEEYGGECCCWEFFLEDLDNLLNKINDDCYWKVNVVNFGWKKTSGETYVKAKDAQNLLWKVLPHTDNTFKVYRYKKGIVITNSHHDSPCGGEWYFVRPCAYSAWDKFWR
jgi:hypothetical protein